MAPTFPGRYAAQRDQPFEVFLIVMPVNKIVAFGNGPPVAAAMPPMPAGLKPDPALGFVQAQFSIAWRLVGLLEDSPSFEQLDACAHARNAARLPVGEDNRPIGGNGSAGIGRETYTAAPGRSESIYDTMPRFGLGAASQHRPRTGRLDAARSPGGRSKSAEGPTEQP